MNRDLNPRHILFPMLLIVTLFVTLSAPEARAQTTTGSIYGSVSDPTGGVIPHASVTATNAATGSTHKAASDGSGNYIFPALDPGTYNIKAEANGFTTVIQKSIALNANQNVHINFSLSVGATSETLTVTAAAPQVDTRESQLADTLTEESLHDMPMYGRDVYDLVTVLPGVTNYSADSAIGTRTGTTFSVNDLPVNGVSYYLDGTPDTAFYQNGGDFLPNPDALQEFRLITSNFDAEFGRSPAAAATVITRSGTRQFHGMAYEYIRNDAFNSRSYFTAPGPAIPLKQDQFGGNAGGPLLPRGRAFFFGSYEQLIVHTPATVGPTQIITANQYERTGDFSHDPASVTNKLGAGFKSCGQKYVICSTSLDPVAQGLLKYVPVESLPSTGTPTTIQQEASANTSNFEGLGRIDYQLTSSHQIEAMFFNSRGTIADPNVGANRILTYSGMDQDENQLDTVLVDTWTKSPQTLNNLRGFYTQNLYLIADMFPNHLLPDLGSDAPTGGVIAAPPDLAITGYWTMGTNQNGPSDILQQSFGLLDTAYLTRGRHQFKFGGAYDYYHYQETGGLQSNGIFTFTGSTSGNALADFLQGNANTLVQTTAVIHRSHNDDPSLFAQDDWHIRTRLTLNLGVRWELFGPFVGDNNLGTFRADTQSTIFPTAPLGLLYQGDAGVPEGVFHTKWDKLSPRVGFALDVFGNGTTSLRGGFGTFYFFGQETYTGNLQQEPFNLSVTTNKTPNLVNPYGVGADPFPFSFNPSNPKWVSGAAFNSAPPNGGTIPLVDEYNLTLERQLSRTTTLHLAYVGNIGRHQFINHDQNQPTPEIGQPTTTASINSRRPYEPLTNFTFGAIDDDDSGVNVNYNGLQTTWKTQIGDRLTVAANYVWSKGMSYESYAGNGGAATTSPDGRDLQLNYGPSTNDIRNSFSATATFQAPNVNRFGLVGKEVLSGWQLNGLTQAHSGVHFTVLSGIDTNSDGVINDLANIVGNPYSGAKSRADKINHYLNVAAFAVPTTPFGNEQRSSLHGPAFFNTDISAFKSFPLYREKQLQFRAETFNTFDNVNLTLGNSSVNLQTLIQDQGTNVNQISGLTGNPREMQFALKLLF